MKLDCLFAVCLLLAAATVPGAATANEPPLADAGLDQTVTRGTTVYLDAGGSRDPDGAIEQYDWTITAESGDVTNQTPRCASCQQTRFQARDTGTYRVTLSVTDDDGATATDALFVTVEPGAPPSVSLAGPGRTTTGEPARFTADVESGAAPLDRLVWTVDGVRVGTQPASGAANTSTRSVRFPTTGTHTVSVAAVDDDGLRDTETRSISVEPWTAPTDSTTSGSSGSGGATGTTPDVDGPQVLTGHGALTGNYDLTDGASGAWMRDGERVGSGPSTSVSFSPGTHELYAATDRGVATFSDDTRTVVADPAPELSTVDVDDGSVVAVDAHATDEFGNLRAVTVRVDGETVETTTADRVGGRTVGDSLSTTTYLDSLEPGKHTVTVHARDGRGQTDVAVRRVDVPGPPEVVAAGFVEDGPIDQYHPRLNESRYTATYRVKVKLNGVEPSSLRAKVRYTTDDWKSAIDRIRTGAGQFLVFERQTYSDSVGSFSGSSTVFWKSEHPINRSGETREVTLAPPEIRVSTVNPQNDHSRRRGMVLDAGESFDPDGSRLDYYWSGVQGERRVPRVTLDSYNVAKLEIADQQDQISEMNDIITWFAPDLVEASIEEPGPFYPNETVPISVVSERYYLSKNTYYNLTSFDVRSAAGRVTDHELVEERPGQVDDPDPEAMSRWHRWTVEVPAKAFVDGDPSAASYPTAHPIVEYGVDLPEPEVYTPTRTELRDVSTSVEYRVERPQYTVRRTANENVRDSLLDEGYSVEDVSQTGHEYQLEEYVKTDDAEYEVNRNEFSERGRRGYFLELNPDWSAAGSTTRTNTWTTTEYEWRSSKSGQGTFTGETRREVVEEPVYRTEKKFRYTTTETYETTVTYEDTYTTTDTEIGYEKKCTAFGCQIYQTTVTETETHTVTRTKTVTRTRTVQETYWSSRPRRVSHEYTGDIRQVTVREPEYEDQYQFKVEESHSETYRVYLAEQRNLVEPAAYAWQPQNTVSSRIQAETAAKALDVRIASTTSVKEWTLKKGAGTEITTVDHPQQDWTILKTIGRGEATLIRHYVRENGKELSVTKQRKKSVTVEHVEHGSAPIEKIKDILTQMITEKYGQ